jgi:hypothetical protein
MGLILVEIKLHTSLVEWKILMLQIFSCYGKKASITFETKPIICISLTFEGKNR